MTRCAFEHCNDIHVGVNISERKSGTERTKKHKKRELVCYTTASGRNWYCSTSSRDSRRYTDFAQSEKQAKQTTFYKQIHGSIKL